MRRHTKSSLHAQAVWICGLGLCAVAQAQTPTPEPPAAPAAPAPVPTAPTASAASADDAPTVTARLDRQEALIGDVIELTITSVAATHVAVNLPTQLDLGSFTVSDRSQSEKDLGDGRMRREFVLQIATFEPGEQSVPSIALTYLGKGGAVLSAPTPTVPIKITSLLANEPEPELKADAPPVRVYEERLWPAYLAGGLLAAGAGVLLGMWLRKRWRNRPKMRPVPPPRPAHEVAFEKLDRLGADLETETDLRPFYFQLSEVLREYLGARFGFDSLELTTDELVAELKNRASRELVLGEIEGWLSAGDLVKFAKVSPTEPEARSALETAIRVVSSTRLRPEPVVPPGATTETKPEDVHHA